ncbi:MAG: DNA integrity scanning diadenylate cyclase DisA [Candidatus ainarchaeum sp.]|nr:DNA integrity scanning diadenylate cyclase DisA [Candidatus ainarchaeum sp.]MDD3975541.1 DNA integrity scanning diadenylate cyclase DisA [Candidatus ainarchaeum sp.]
MSPQKIISKTFFQEDSNYRIIEDIKSNTILDITEILPLITPGTKIRSGLDEVLFGNLGGLFVLGDNDNLEDIKKGGIDLDLDFSSQKLFELSKMDGAIILSSDLKKITGANKHLMPDRNISSTETGMRHRSAEQTAIATGLPVIAISHRRSIITLYFRDQKYVLQDIGQLFIKGNYLLNNLREYRAVIDKDQVLLIKEEYNLLDGSFKKAISLIQKILFFYKHKVELDKIIIELGKEGYDILQTLNELVFDLDNILFNIIKDFSEDLEDININYDDFLFEKIDFLKKLDFRTIYDQEHLVEIIGIKKMIPKGYSVLQKVQNIDSINILKIISKFKNLEYIKSANIGKMCLIEGIDSSFAKFLKSELDRLNQDLFSVSL